MGVTLKTSQKNIIVSSSSLPRNCHNCHFHCSAAATCISIPPADRCSLHLIISFEHFFPHFIIQYSFVAVAWGTRIAQWLECWTCVGNVTGLNPCRSDRKKFFSTVERSWSFCQKCTSQVTAKYACTLYICGFA